MTISSDYMNLQSLLTTGTSESLPESVTLVEAEVSSVEVKNGVLVGFNGGDKHYSVSQPVFVKTKKNIVYMNAGDVQVGDILIAVDESGTLLETEVVSIELDTQESQVFDVRTEPQPWFITKHGLIIA